MGNYSSLAGIAMTLIGLIFVPSVQAEKPTKVEIGKIGKAATAYVAGEKGGVGAAFCIHPSGWFVSSEEVARTAKDGVLDLTVNPGLKEEVLITARVVRADPASNLALLRATGHVELPVLTFGSSADLAELMNIIVFGISARPRMTLDEKVPPAISIHLGTISSLRSKGGQLQFFELELPTRNQYSGGPILDDNGKVVGMVGHQASNETVRHAIPADTITQFLAPPNIEFTPPELTHANLESPLEFQARITSMFPAEKQFDVALILQTDNEPEQRHKMELKDGVHRVSTVLVPPNQQLLLDVSGRFENGMINGDVLDQEFQIGPKKIKLSDCTRLKLRPETLAVLRDGTSLQGPVVGLNAVAFQVGGQSVTLDLNKATSVEVRVPRGISGVNCTVEVRLDEKVVGRVEARATVKGTTFAEPTTAAKVEIRPPEEVSKAVVTKLLPGTITDVRLGGNGRFLVLHLPKLRKLAVFDVVQSKVVHYIPLESNDIVYTVGMDKLVIGKTASGTVERWSLLSGKMELTQAILNAPKISTLLMGYGSSGPLVINDKMHDLESLDPLPITFEKGGPERNALVSGDGTVFAMWDDNYSRSWVLEGDKLLNFVDGHQGYVVPGPDGRFLFTGEGIFTNSLKAIAEGPTNLKNCLPATDGNYILSIVAAEDKKAGTVGVFITGAEQPLVENTGIAHQIRHSNRARESFGSWKRFFFIPPANLIVVIPPSDDRVELHPFDVNAALDASNLDYLLVTSLPPRVVQPGTALNYPIQVKARQTNITFRVETGPAGLAVSTDGVIHWNVPADAQPGDEEVVVVVANGNAKEVFHNFKVRIVK